MTDGDTLIVVAEELGEVAEDLKSGNPEHMRIERLETITCLVRWYERENDAFPSQSTPEAQRDVCDRTIALGQLARTFQSAENAARSRLGFGAGSVRSENEESQA